MEFDSSYMQLVVVNEITKEPITITIQELAERLIGANVLGTTKSYQGMAKKVCFSHHNLHIRSTYIYSFF
jgi:hypothetical protein